MSIIILLVFNEKLNSLTDIQRWCSHFNHEGFIQLKNNCKTPLGVKYGSPGCNPGFEISHRKGGAMGFKTKGIFSLSRNGKEPILPWALYKLQFYCSLFLNTFCKTITNSNQLLVELGAFVPSWLLESFDTHLPSLWLRRQLLITVNSWWNLESLCLRG